METDLHALLSAACARTYPDVAPLSTPRPYVTWQGLGGQALRFLSNDAADKRHTLMQINVWAETRLAALTLIRQIEDAMCASAAFTAKPEGEPLSQYEADHDPPLYGSVQRFSIYATR
jgi:hypothetical protein